MSSSVTLFLKFVYISILLPAIILCDAATFILENGDQLSGKVISTSDENIIIENEILGRITLPKARLKQEAPAPKKQNSGAAQTSNQAAEESKIDNLLNSKTIAWTKNKIDAIIPEEWKGSINLGFSSTDSASKQSRWNLSAEARKKGTKNHYKTRAFYNYRKQTNRRGETDTTTDKFGGYFDYTHDFTKVWFAHSNTDYLRDSIKGINNQVTETVGIGYRIFYGKKMKFEITPGASLQYNDTENRDQKQWSQLATVLNTFEYKIAKNLKFEQRGTYSINLEDGSDYQTRFSSSLSTKLNDWTQIKIRFEHDHDNLVQDNAPSSTQRLMVAFGIPF